MDTVEILIFLPIALMMVALAFVILKGWGDRLIAGYNTASKEEQEKFNIKRLRIVVAAMILFVPALILVAACFDDITGITLDFLPVLLIVVVIGIILATGVLFIVEACFGGGADTVTMIKNIGLTAVLFGLIPLSTRIRKRTSSRRSAAITR